MGARKNILKKLRSSLEGSQVIEDDYNVDIVTSPWQYEGSSGRIARLKQMMESVRTEVYMLTADTWVQEFAILLQEKGLKNCLYSPETEYGKHILDFWQKQQDKLPELKSYDRPIEQWKEEMFFGIEASITDTKGAVAATGSLILWPDKYEPRLMSLVPPVHFAILKSSEIYNNFYEAQISLNWAQVTPTNALLISGPSKTADIEQVLAYGAHGPKELIVFILEDQ